MGTFHVFGKGFLNFNAEYEIYRARESLFLCVRGRGSPKTVSHTLQECWVAMVWSETGCKAKSRNRQPLDPKPPRRHKVKTFPGPKELSEILDRAVSNIRSYQSLHGLLHAG